MVTIYDLPISYDLHPSVAHVQTILANLKARTGLDLEAWVARVKAEGPAEEKARCRRGRGLADQKEARCGRRRRGSSGQKEEGG